jgi:hypothetical protein
MVQLCLAGGSSQTVTVATDASTISVRSFDHKGTLTGEFKISSSEAKGLVGNINKALPQVQAAQAETVRACLKPFTDKLLAALLSPPVPPPPPSEAPLDAALKKLLAGNVAFNNPEHMTVSRPRLVEAKLSTTLSPSELKSQLTEAGNKEVAGLDVGDRMSATLNGGAAFDISPSGPQVQWISEQQVTTWTWNVTPKTAGTQYLILSFDAVITLNGKDANRNIRTLTHTIQVDVGWPTTPSEWFDLSKKWFDNVNWLWASILLPIGLFLVGWWRRFVRHQKGTLDSDT